jgi:predicted acetyltransferase
LTWSLDLLGTLPGYRRRGLARALLDSQLGSCDEEGTAVWLEATDPVNPVIYERFGFQTVAHVDRPEWLPGYWVMRRDPRPTTSAVGRSKNS